ncbi:hypothetical protein F511_47289 [Dorcoceras hygrometricum]|uniref:Uncharacterized protein n=1 Tax=Dorcoceras hygrometricum TaxID=472368 RepID=A0A2Z6ZRF4_9LAMI|nr:hypothetical protein F511_47289 [Dorcoceras hygrometricum]
MHESCGQRATQEFPSHGQRAMVSRAQQRARDAVVAAAQGGGPVIQISIFDLKIKQVRYNLANHIDQIRGTLALIPLLGIRIRPPVRQRKNKNYRHREAINTNNSSICIDIHRVFRRVTSLALVPGSNRCFKNPALLG